MSEMERGPAPVAGDRASRRVNAKEAPNDSRGVSPEQVAEAERRATEVLVAVTRNLLDYREQRRQTTQHQPFSQPISVADLMAMTPQQLAVGDDPGERARKAAIRAMGKLLFDLGGRDAMDRALDKAWTELGGSAASPIDHAWDGIGGGAWIA